mmetsp:Transcript_144359/g.266185  ORF Transcript_144359/g.266185 Transcript_144359/m.266185 type:complete len:204 (+) Transcript_144359:536-1147(+)
MCWASPPALCWQQTPAWQTEASICKVLSWWILGSPDCLLGDFPDSWYASQFHASQDKTHASRTRGPLGLSCSTAMCWRIAPLQQREQGVILRFLQNWPSDLACGNPLGIFETHAGGKTDFALQCELRRRGWFPPGPRSRSPVRRTTAERSAAQVATQKEDSAGLPAGSPRAVRPSARQASARLRPGHLCQWTALRHCYRCTDH